MEGGGESGEKEEEEERDHGMTCIECELATCIIFYRTSDEANDNKYKQSRL